jgi:cytochrome o ubiquinol oxidase operon protein cyoD
MSAHAHAHGAGGANDNHDAHGAHGDVKSYMIGFFLSVVLTALPFGLVMSGSLPGGTAAPVCFAFAAVQIVVHLIYFLHMNPRSSKSWNGAAFAFTLIILLILVVGTLWVMYHMNLNMMPGMMSSQ